MARVDDADGGNGSGAVVAGGGRGEAKKSSRTNGLATSTGTVTSGMSASRVPEAMDAVTMTKSCWEASGTDAALSSITVTS